MNKVRLLFLSLMLTIIIGITHAQDNSSAKKGPEIEFEKLVHDFGDVPYNGDGYCEFRFTNTGDEPLILQKPKSSCGCFRVTFWPKESIAPGKSDVIKAKYLTTRKGVINKKLTIQSNAINDSIVILSVKGTILDNENIVIYDSQFSGEVRDKNKKGIANALVTATNKSNGQQYSTKTDTDGEYRLFCPEGNYEICATHYAYQSKTKENFDLAPNHSHDLKFELEKIASHSIANNNSSSNTQNQNLASNTNSTKNTLNNTQNENDAQPVVNNKSTSKEVNLEDGLVAYFPFDYCHINHTYDISWNGLAGHVYQSIPNEIKHETGYKGKCFHFPLSCRNNHIWVRTGNSLKFPDAVSFAFWFKVEDDGKGQYIGMDDEEKVVLNSGRMKFFYKETEKGAIHGGIDLGKHRIEVFNNDESCSAPFRPDNKWNHVVMVITSSYFTIYLNGNEVAAKNKNKNSNNSNPENLNIGGISRGWSGKYPFHGWIDEFLIYNRELTGAEAKALYQGKEPDKDYLAYKRAEVGSLKDAIAYLKDCTNDSYRKGIEDEIVNTKINSVSDVAYCNDNYPKLADRLEDKTYDLINSVNASADINDCETYLKVFPKGKHKSAVVALKNEIASYNVAKNGGKAECNAYLQKYPNGRFVSEIRFKMDDMDRATVAANNNTGG